MPPPETFERNQTALYFEWRGKDRYNEPRVASPREIEVRWEWRQATMLGPQGNPVSVDAQVVVDEDIVLNSLMWEGGETEWYGGEPGTSSGSAGEATFLMQVVATDFVPDIKGREMRRTVGLVFFRDAMPEVV